MEKTLDSPCYPKKDKILQDVLEANKNTEDKRHEKQIRKRTESAEDEVSWNGKFAQDNFEQGKETGRAALPLSHGGKRATYMDYDGVVHEQGSDRRADDLLREPLQSQEGDVTEAREQQSTSVQQLLHTWEKRRAGARQTKCPQKFYNKQKD